MTTPSPTPQSMTPTSPSKTRLRRLRRADPESLPPFHLTRRDEQIIEAVYTYRALSTPQIMRLFFPSKSGGVAPSPTRAHERLKLLYHHGYLTRIAEPLSVNEPPKPFVYMLDKKGAEVVKRLQELTKGSLDWSPRDNITSYTFLSHLVATNDVRLAFELATARLGWTIDPWMDEKALKRKVRTDKDYVTITNTEGKTQKVAVVADGFFTLHQPIDGKPGETYKYHHFLEIDMGTITGQSSVWGRKDWVRKVLAYNGYHQSGLYQKHYGGREFRVVTVTTSASRLATLKELTEKAGGARRYWFACLDQLTPETALTQPIWEAAGDRKRYRFTR